MAGRFIDKLKKAARLDPVKKEIQLDSGEEVVMYVTPLTAAERERAKKDARSDDPGAFCAQLLIRKARNGNNQPLFTPRRRCHPEERGPRLRPAEVDARSVGCRRGRRPRHEKRRRRI